MLELSKLEMKIMNKLTNNQLNELNIFTLRELARQAGVNSPTSKKKDQLIQEILDIQSGSAKPAIAKTKQGRPPKSTTYGFADLFDFNNFFRPVTPVVMLRQEIAEIDEEDVVTKLGYIEILENLNAFLWVQNNFDYQKYFVSSQIVKQYDLRSGDKVLAVVGGSNNMVVMDVCNINNVPVASLQKNKKDYLKIEAQIPSCKLSFNAEKYSNLTINNGENVYIYGSNNNINTTTVLDMLNACDADCKIYINLSVAEKNKIYLNQSFNVEYMCANFTASKEISTKVLMLAIERAKRAFEQGQKVVLAVDDISSVSAFDAPDYNLTKQLVSVAKDGKRAGKISTFVVVPTNSTLNLIEKLADRRLKIADNSVENMD